MTTPTSTTLPADLPVPAASDAALHLGGHPLPPLIELPSTSGGFVDLFLLSLRRPVLLFIYPRTAAPGEQVPDSWNAIAGARGCTPELCNVRDHYRALLDRERGGKNSGNSDDESSSLAVFGLSTQSTAYQSEAAKRLQLPFPLLSDASFALQKALDLPTFTWRNETFLQRCTLLLRDGQVTQYQHPVFPPNKAAEEALKMLDASKPKVVDTASEMPISSAYMHGVRSDLDVGHDRERSVGGGGGDVGEYAMVQTAPPCSKPLPRDLTGSIRSFAGLQRRSAMVSSGSHALDWRNSLVAVDTHTGEVVGILAHGVTLSSDEGAAAPTAAAGTPPSDEDVDEIPTPTAGALPYTSAAIYYDPDVRPSSRAGSVLGEDTFAPPPPVPKKGTQAISIMRSEQDAQSDVNDDDDDASSPDCFSDGEVVDGQVRTRAKHVERHRPDLLRDEYVQHHRNDPSDASGSTVGGPALQLWRKARGGRKGEAKRRAKKEAKAAAAEEDAEKRRQIRATKAETMAREGTTPRKKTQYGTATQTDAIREPLKGLVAPEFHPPSVETIDAARAQRVRHRKAELDTSNGVQSIEDNVWRSALESGALPIDAAYTHLPACRAAQKQSPPTTVVAAASMQQPMQGNSVLIEFLAGSRITASVIRDAASQFFRPGATTTTTANTAAAAANSPDAFSPTVVALRYMPVLPSHLLWFFGMGNSVADSKKTADTVAITGTANTASVSGELLRLLSTTSVFSAALNAATLPTQWLDTATRGAASTAWEWGVSATGWIGSGLTYITGGDTKSTDKAAAADDLYRDWIATQPGDEDADEWEWQAPPPGLYTSAANSHVDELANTPRPVYRRKRPVPSLYGGFNFRQLTHDRIADDGDAATDGKRLRRDSSRYSIVHFDQDGVGRHAVLRAAGISP